MRAKYVKLNTQTTLSGGNKMKHIIQQKIEIVNVLKLSLKKYPQNMDEKKTLESIKNLELEIKTLDATFNAVYNELSKQAIH